MVMHAHLSHSFPFLGSIIIFNVSMRVDIFVFEHQVNTLVNHLSLNFAVYHISNLISFKRVTLPPLNYPGWLVRSEMFTHIVYPGRHECQKYKLNLYFIA